MIWKFHHPQMTINQLGFIPSFLSENDPRTAREQLDAHYRWNPFSGFRLSDNDMIQYPGDPPHYPLASAMLRHERILFYPHAWVMVMQPDRSFEICRMD